MRSAAFGFFLMLGLTLLWSCKPQREVIIPPPIVEVPQPVTVTDSVKTALDTIEKVAPRRVASIRKTPCYGQCPVFVLSFYDNGKATYEGKRFTDLQGNFEATLAETFYSRLAEEMRKSRFVDLAPSYPYKGVPIPDFPETVTFVNWGGASHEIRNNHDAPKVLRDFEDFLLGYVEILAWKKAE
jgi:hypothetical protein